MRSARQIRVARIVALAAPMMAAALLAACGNPTGPRAAREQAAAPTAQRRDAGDTSRTAPVAGGPTIPWY